MDEPHYTAQAVVTWQNQGKFFNKTLMGTSMVNLLDVIRQDYDVQIGPTTILITSLS